VSSTSGFGDWTYKRFSRRQSGTAVLPSNQKPIPRMTVIIDTSGSMSDADLALACGAIANGLRSMLDPRGVRVIAGDTDARVAKQVFRPDQVELVGGGGTDMAKLVVLASEEKPAPKAIVVLTDGKTDWPSKPVAPKVLVALTRKNDYWMSRVPTWMEKLLLKP